MLKRNLIFHKKNTFCLSAWHFCGEVEYRFNNLQCNQANNNFLIIFITNLKTKNFAEKVLLFYYLEASFPIVLFNA